MDGELLSDAFVELADTMVADFDVIDFLHTLTERSVQLLDAAAAGVLLADPRGELRLVAASTEAARVLELFQLQNDQGPCLDCFRNGEPVAAPDLTAAGQRWPQFAAAAAQAGFAAVQALPKEDPELGSVDLGLGAPTPCINRARLSHLNRGYADIKALMSLSDRFLDLEVSATEVETMSREEVERGRDAAPAEQSRATAADVVAAPDLCLTLDIPSGAGDAYRWVALGTISAAGVGAGAGTAARSRELARSRPYGTHHTKPT